MEFANFQYRFSDMLSILLNDDLKTQCTSTIKITSD